MNKKIIKLLIAFILISFLSIYVINISFCDYYDPGAFENPGSSKATDMVSKSAQVSIETARIVSGAIALIVLLVIAMKYMLASPGDKADIKKHAVAYVIGAFVLFSVTEIITILIEIGEKISG